MALSRVYSWKWKQEADVCKKIRDDGKGKRKEPKGEGEDVIICLFLSYGLCVWSSFCLSSGLVFLQ